jgi:hypothetical protein
VARPAAEPTGAIGDEARDAVDQGRQTAATGDEPHGLPADSAPSGRAPAVPVPGDLRGAHRFVTATRDAAVGRRAAQDGRISIGPRAGVVHMVLNRELLRRALLIAHAVIGEAERRGWEVTSDQGLAGGSGPRGVAVVVGAHAYPIEIHEVTETVPFTEEEIRAWRAEDRWDLYHREGKLPPPQRKRKSRVYVREAPGPLRPEDRTGSLSMAVPGHVCGADRRRPRGMEFSGVSLS